MTRESTCITLCIARHLARIGQSRHKTQAAAIKATSVTLMRETDDAKLKALLQTYAKEIQSAWHSGKLMSGDKQRVASVEKLESGMREAGLI